MSILDNEGHDPNGLGNRPTWDNRPGINGVLERKDAEIERLRAALVKADYYINRLEAANRGRVVRDLDEAYVAWETARMPLTLEQSATESK